MGIFKDRLGVRGRLGVISNGFGKGDLDLPVCLYWLYISLKQVWAFVLVVLLLNPQPASVALKLAR